MCGGDFVEVYNDESQKGITESIYIYLYLFSFFFINLVCTYDCYFTILYSMLKFLFCSETEIFFRLINSEVLISIKIWYCSCSANSFSKAWIFHSCRYLGCRSYLFFLGYSTQYCWIHWNNIQYYQRWRSKCSAMIFCCNVSSDVPLMSKINDPYFCNKICIDHWGFFSSCTCSIDRFG